MEVAAGSTEEERRLYRSRAEAEAGSQRLGDRPAGAGSQRLGDRPAGAGSRRQGDRPAGAGSPAVEGSRPGGEDTLEGSLPSLRALSVTPSVLGSQASSSNYVISIIARAQLPLFAYAHARG